MRRVSHEDLQNPNQSADSARPTFPIHCPSISLRPPRQKHPSMRLTFPHYLFPSFLLRHQSPDPDERRSIKKRSRDEKIQAAGNASFAYLSCKGCHTPCNLLLDAGLIAVTNSGIISKGFAGRYGRGYLCRDVINVDLGRVQERSLLTGMSNLKPLFDDRPSYCPGSNMFHLSHKSRMEILYRKGTFATLQTGQISP